MKSSYHHDDKDYIVCMHHDSRITLPICIMVEEFYYHSAYRQCNLCHRGGRVGFAPSELKKFWAVKGITVGQTDTFQPTKYRMCHTPVGKKQLEVAGV